MSSENLAERLEAKLRRLSSLLIIIWVALLGFRPMNNVDLGWHIAQGRWMVHHLSFYRHDVFNYPNLDHSVVDEYPLFQLVLFPAWKLGWWGPCLLTAGIYALLACLLFRAAKSFNLAASSLFLVSVLLMFIYVQVAFTLRPHVVTYLCIAILGVFLLHHRNAPSWTLFGPIALMQVAWVNCHSAFVIGPAMVAIFGLEMTLRHWIASKVFPWTTAKTWTGAWLLVLLACFVNPYGWSRFYLPIYQDQLESIRAYVGEMEPLYGGMLAIYSSVAYVTFVVLVMGVLARKGATAYSFLLLAAVFYVQAQSVQKAWPIFGVFVPLVILGSGAFSTTLIPRKIEAWLNVLGHFALAVIAGMAIDIAINPTLPTSIESQWKELGHGRSELSVEAAKWMKAHDVAGRLFHRCEIGGLLQREGFAQTFADTGFGKYDEAFIHEVGLVNERPALIPRYLAAYKPDFVVCNNLCFGWPYYLIQSGWHPIFYSPNSSVWTQATARADQPAVKDEEIQAAFDRDVEEFGLPTDRALLGRNIIMLNSLGLEDFAFAKLSGLPEEDHKQPWYWEAARIMCFSKPPFSDAHREALRKEGDSLHDEPLTRDFHALCLYASGDVDGALRILSAIPSKYLSNAAAELLLKIELDRKDPEALALARRTDCFDLRNGRHWMYLAQAEEQFGSVDAAGVAWKKAVFYYPDVAELMQAGAAFAAKNHDAALQQAIDESNRVYGQPAP